MQGLCPGCISGILIRMINRKTDRTLIAAFVFAGILFISIAGFAAGLTRFENETLEHINQFRAEYGLAPLEFNEKMQSIAREHSEWMYQNRAFGHQDFMSRHKKSGRRGCGENLGWNSRTPREQFGGWRDSPGHRKIMLDSKFRYAGVSKVGAYVTLFVCD